MVVLRVVMMVVLGELLLLLVLLLLAMQVARVMVVALEVMVRLLGAN